MRRKLLVLNIITSLQPILPYNFTAYLSMQLHKSQRVIIRDAGRLKILILVNLEINRKKTDNVYQLPTTAHVISLKRKTTISQTVCAVTF